MPETTARREWCEARIAIRFAAWAEWRLPDASPRRCATTLKLVFGLLLGIMRFHPFPAAADALEGPPITTEVSSLDELTQALQKATPGSIIRLAPGVYQIYADDPVFHVKGVQGLPDRPIVIQGTVAADGRRASIIDGGRSLDAMLQIEERYGRPGTRPPDLDEILFSYQFRTERALNCFFFEGVSYVIVENLTVRDCWPVGFFIYKDSRYLTIRASTFVGGTYPVFAGRYSDHILVEDNVWTQDPSGYTEEQSGYSGRVELTPRPGRMWDTIPWGILHHGSRMHLNGGLVGAFRTAGNIIIRNNVVRNAYNGLRMRALRCPRDEVCNSNIEIAGNDFQFIRDNPVEPEDSAINWWIHHNRIYNSHAWFSLDGVRGGPLYIFGNVGWFDDLPSQRCVQSDWAADWVAQAGKPTEEGECNRGRAGKVVKLGPVVTMAQPIYIFNNSWLVRTPILAGGRSRVRFWNNAIEFCDPKTAPAGLCRADVSMEPGCVQSPAEAVDSLANAFPLGLDRVPFYDCFAASAGDEYGYSISNHEDFPDALQKQGRPFHGWHGEPGFVNAAAGDFRLRADSMAKGKACAVTRAADGSLVCAPAEKSADPDVGAFQGNRLVTGPDYLNVGDEPPRLVRATWLAGDGIVRLEVAFSVAITDPPGDTRIALRQRDGTTVASEPCRRIGPTTLHCGFGDLKVPPAAMGALLIPRTIRSTGGKPVTLWAAALRDIEFLP